MTDDARPGSTETAVTDPETCPPGPPEEMGVSFYAALALIGILVLMVVFLNYPAARASSGTLLSGSDWTLQSLADAYSILIPAWDGTDVTAAFSRDGQMSGNAGCNRYSASYQTRDYSISLTGISSTEMFCQGDGVMEQESLFLADLSKTSSFRVSESSLKFYDSAGRTILVFVPA
jgi:heat shock protein HslJ